MAILCNFDSSKLDKIYISHLEIGLNKSLARFRNMKFSKIEILDLLYSATDVNSHFKIDVFQKV